MKVIEGNVLEGGGQLLRNTVALSALLQTPVTVHKIRNGRSPPGLKNQHATGLRLVAEICCAQLTGAHPGSESISFTPGPLRLPGSFHANPQTAASTALLLQVALPCLLFAPTPEPSTLMLQGGTNAAQAPQIDYTQHVLLPFLRRHFALSPELNVFKRGYFPKGGGTVAFSLPPVRGPLPPVTLTERGRVAAVRGRAYVAGLPAELARKMRDAATASLVAAGVDARLIQIDALRERDCDVHGSGSGVVLWAETEGGCVLAGSSLGTKKKDPSVVGAEAAAELSRNLSHGGCVDEHLQVCSDQIIIFLALAKGESTISTGPITMHTRTAIWVAEQLTEAKFEVQESPGGRCLITCNGIGFSIPHA
ncbi:RNA 3'-terminal phosphate cyclase [Artomyces pyxidatus]|uniref:RNA 3'-terminal phosphate cyclase n=1 Tax=Artomyces pyxidatus TaxID=48021 RepID=A0ACB8SMV0_9AGAM|nr:RNA 3'-terminal phosphate cyclase [Artomyces pyxidatus]